MRVWRLALAGLATLAACSPSPWKDVTGNGRSDREAEAMDKACNLLVFPNGASGLSAVQIDSGVKAVFACMAAHGWQPN